MNDTINLIPTRRLVLRARRRLASRWLLVVVSAAGVAGVLMGTIRVGAIAGLEGLETKLGELRADISLAEAQIPIIRDDLETIGRRMQVNDQLADRPDWSLLLGIVDRARAEKIVLLSCRLEPSTGDGPAAGVIREDGPVRLSVRGLAVDQNEMSKFVLALEGTDLFEETTGAVSRRRTLSGGHERIEFDVTCLLGATARAEVPTP